MRITAAVAVAATILVLSAVPTSGGVASTGPFDLVGLDKWLHAGAYAALAATVTYAIGARSRREVAVAVAIAVGVGLLAETMQLGISYRSFDLVDAVANALGAVLGAVTWRLLGVGRRLEPVAGAEPLD